jgi:hypothetical protein
LGLKVLTGTERHAVEALLKGAHGHRSARISRRRDPIRFNRLKFVDTLPPVSLKIIAALSERKIHAGFASSHTDSTGLSGQFWAR